jgi:hypothetical protein
MAHTAFDYGRALHFDYGVETFPKRRKFDHLYQ